jgi:hypothetical protein
MLIGTSGYLGCLRTVIRNGRSILTVAKCLK